MKNKLFLLLGLLAGSLFLGGILSSQTAQAVDSFTITNFDVEMRLDRDDEGRSTLRVVEAITADFTQTNQNRGIERAFVKDYDGHDTSFELISVTDEEGRSLAHHWNGDTLRIGERNTYVYGSKTYKITYTQRDVTRHYQDTAQNEFYWDVIGTDWRVPIQQASVRIALSPDIQREVETDMQCYVGRQGSTERCQVDSSEVDGVYAIDTQNIGNGSGVTTAIGFAPETFVPYQESLAERLFRLWLIVFVVTTAVGVIVLVWLAIRAYNWKYRRDELGTIVPEYLPPKDYGVATAAGVIPGVSPVMAAELTDLAVRGYIQILETKPKRSFWRAAEYDIKVIRDVGELRQEEREVLQDMFGDVPEVDERLPLKSLKNNDLAYARFRDNDKKLRDLMRNQYGLKHIDETKRSWYKKAALALLVIGLLTLSPVLLVASIVAFAIGKTLWVLSDEGLALQRYMRGLEMYIKVAETERLKMLQSPEGAAKVGLSDPNDTTQLVKLYEKVLPYAILFRQEKEWSKRLGDYYEKSNYEPGWYSGSTAFNAVAFGSMMSSFTSTASATSSSSSSSGGSGGGGFSGGGGGGGGGGGW